MKLLSYFRSSAAYRVRIALNLKGLPYDVIPVHLLKEGGEQHTQKVKQYSSESLIPVLLEEWEGQEHAITQSLAIIEYVDEQYPHKPLLPTSPLERAYVRSIALSIACDIHPLNNLRVLKYLNTEFKVNEAQKNAWYKHWCRLGLMNLENRLTKEKRYGQFCLGDTPTIADCCLIPQVFNAKRFDVDMSDMPILSQIVHNAASLSAFIEAEPSRQMDAE